MNKAHIQEQRVYRKDLVHTVPTEMAGTNAVPFTTQEEDEKAKQEEEKPEAEVNREEKVEPFSVKEETHKELEELQTQQPVEVYMDICDLQVFTSLFLSGCSCA